MGIVRGNDDIIITDPADDVPHQIFINVYGYKTLAQKIVAGFEPHAKVKRFLFFVFVVHPLQEIGNPSNAGLAQDKSESGIAVEGAGINDRAEKLSGAKA